MTIRGFFFIGAVLAGLTSSAAQAQTQNWRSDLPKTRTVSYADLDLSTTAGASALMLRLTRAANEVCDHWTAPMDPPAQEFSRRCVTEALGDAVAKVNRPMVSAMLTQKSSTQFAVASNAVAKPNH